MEPQLFDFKGQRVRTLIIDGEPYFVGKDVGSILGYARTADAIKAHVDDDDKLTRQFTDSGQKRSMTVINESGLYSLILSSKLPQAREFKHWVTGEVLPAIRKSGTYTIRSQNAQFRIPQTFAEALQLAADQAKKIEEQQPKVDYFDSQMRNPGLMTITEIAKDFGQTPYQLNKTLNKLGIQYKQGKRWVLYKEYANKGYAQYEPFAFKNKSGEGDFKNNLKWTQRGRKFIYDELAHIGVRPVVEQMELLGI